MDELLSKLDKNARERLRWRVMREFGVLPGSRVFRKLSDIDLIVCGLHMLLDMRQDAQNEAGDMRNPAFDGDRFEWLRGAKRE